MEFCLYCVNIFLVTLYILIKFVDSIVNKTKSLESSDNQYQNTCLECDKHWPFYEWLSREMKITGRVIK